MDSMGGGWGEFGGTKKLGRSSNLAGSTACVDTAELIYNAPRFPPGQSLSTAGGDPSMERGAHLPWKNHTGHARDGTKA